MPVPKAEKAALGSDNDDTNQIDDSYEVWSHMKSRELECRIQNAQKNLRGL
jgi:hypothetical protein